MCKTVAILVSCVPFSEPRLPPFTGGSLPIAYIVTVMRPLLFAAFAFLLVLLRPATADARECLAVEDRRALISSGQVVPLERAIRAAKVQSKDVIDARLCRGGKGYVYLLTILARDGKVTQATVDASSGKGAGAS